MDEIFRLEQVVADLAAELRATADWAEERAAVLDQVGAELDPTQQQLGVPAAVRVEAARLRGRAALIRQVLARATR